MYAFALAVAMVVNPNLQQKKQDIPPPILNSTQSESRSEAKSQTQLKSGKTGKTNSSQCVSSAYTMPGISITTSTQCTTGDDNGWKPFEASPAPQPFKVNK